VRAIFDLHAVRGELFEVCGERVDGRLGERHRAVALVRLGFTEVGLAVVRVYELLPYLHLAPQEVDAVDFKAEQLSLPQPRGSGEQVQGAESRCRRVDERADGVLVQGHDFGFPLPWQAHAVTRVARDDPVSYGRLQRRDQIRVRDFQRRRREYLRPVLYPRLYVRCPDAGHGPVTEHRVDVVAQSALDA